MKGKTLWMTRTALMIALLVLLQAVTKSAGQFVTGSCVNLVLAVSVLSGGFWCGFTVALLSPFFAFLLGIGPALLQIVPAVSLGNLAFAALLWVLCKKAFALQGRRKLLSYAAAAAAAAVKFLVLLVVVVKLLLPVLGLPEKQAAAMSLMFSWPQLVTALIGGVVGVTIAPLIGLSKKSTT